MNISLNLDTKQYKEQYEGIMICGYNWGADSQGHGRGPSDSFFSDQACGNKYRNRIVEWFRLWEIPLSRIHCEDMLIEKSISQTNWLPTQSVSLRNQDVFEACIQHANNFTFHLKKFKPRVLLLMGKQLIDVLNSNKCASLINPIYGPSNLPQHIYNDVNSDSKPLRKFRVSFQEFKGMHVVCLPHPTGSRGLSNEYIASFKPQIKPILDSFKKIHMNQK